jgi:uncharacterized protein with PhoU and TrkA domain
VKVRGEAPAIGRTLRDISLPTETGMWVMAIRSGMDWEFDPGPDDIVSEGDVLLFRGPEEGVNLIRELMGARPMPAMPESDAPPLSELDRAVDILVEMKDLAEAAVGLAYSSLLFNNRALAAEVGTLEARSDILHDELESWVLRAAPEARNPDELRGLLRLASAETVVERGSRADGHSLKELRLETETGMFVLAVQRGSRWIYRPRAGFQLREGDRLISVGPEEGEEELQALCGVPAPAEA